MNECGDALGDFFAANALLVPITQRISDDDALKAVGRFYDAALRTFNHQEIEPAETSLHRLAEAYTAANDAIGLMFRQL